MQKSVSQSVEMPRVPGKPRRLGESHRKAGVHQFRCSDFLASKGLLAEGERANRDSSRNASVVVTDLKTGTLKGGASLLLRSIL